MYVLVCIPAVLLIMSVQINSPVLLGKNTFKKKLWFKPILDWCSNSCSNHLDLFQFEHPYRRLSVWTLKQLQCYLKSTRNKTPQSTSTLLLFSTSPARDFTFIFQSNFLESYISTVGTRDAHLYLKGSRPLKLLWSALMPLVSPPVINGNCFYVEDAC